MTAERMPAPIDVRPEEWAIVRDILAHHARGVEVWAFGSRTTGKARKYSDLDLALVSKQSLSLARLADIEAAFEESDLPFKVDILDLASVSSAFREIVERQKVVLVMPKS